MQEEFIEQFIEHQEETEEYNELQDIMKSAKAESFLGEIYFAASFELKGSSYD